MSLREFLMASMHVLKPKLQRYDFLPFNLIALHNVKSSKALLGFETSSFISFSWPNDLNIAIDFWMFILSLSTNASSDIIAKYIKPVEWIFQVFFRNLQLFKELLTGGEKPILVNKVEEIRIDQ